MMFPLQHKIQIPRPYVRSEATDIRVTFERVRRELAAQAVCVPLRDPNRVALVLTKRGREAFANAAVNPDTQATPPEALPGTLGALDKLSIRGGA